MLHGRLGGLRHKVRQGTEAGRKKGGVVRGDDLEARRGTLALAGETCVKDAVRLQHLPAPNNRLSAIAAPIHDLSPFICFSGYDAPTKSAYFRVFLEMRGVNWLSTFAKTLQNIDKPQPHAARKGIVFKMASYVLREPLSWYV